MLPDQAEVSHTELQQLHADQAVHLIDVREPHEWAMSRIPDAQHIPLDQLMNHGESLRQIDRPIVFYCHSGSRSMVAHQLMLRQGVSSQSLAGGIVAWYQGGGDLIA